MEGKILPLAGLERTVLKKAIPLDTPFSVYIYPTNYCNFRCEYCAHSLGRQGFEQKYGFPMETMALSTYHRCIDQLTEFPQQLKTISLTGQGEPLLHPRLPEMVAYAKEKGVSQRVEFMSNGALLNQRLSRDLVDAGLDCIRISLQGLSSEKYRRICGVNLDFGRLVSEISWLYHHKKQCQVFVKVMDIALDPGEEQRFYELFRPIADRVYIEQCRPVYAGVEATQNLQTDADRYGRRHAPRRVCPLCFFMLGVFPNGDVFPCETIYRPAHLGNVNADRLVELWNSDQMHRFWEMQLSGRKNENPGCAQCCAPDDVSHPEDVLDDEAANLLERLKKEWANSPKTP